MPAGEVEDGVLMPYEGSYDYGTNDEYKISSFFSLFLGLLVLCILLSNAVGRMKCNWFPEAGVPLVIGILVGSLCLLRSGYITDSVGIHDLFLLVPNIPLALGL